jgi:hypothetical protein
LQHRSSFNFTAHDSYVVLLPKLRCVFLLLNWDLHFCQSREYDDGKPRNTLHGLLIELLYYRWLGRSISFCMPDLWSFPCLFGWGGDMGVEEGRQEGSEIAK